MSKIATIGAALTTVIILLIAGSATAIVQALFGSSNPSTAAVADIPADYLAFYQAAATNCPGLDWSVLAAIGKIETNHGRSTLPGVSSGENFAGAGGPMQFLQPTWDGVLARHQIPRGGATPPSRYNPHDAIHAAAFNLCDNGARRGDLRAAIFAYNTPDWYVNDVLAQSEQYRVGPAPAAPGALRTDWSPEQATVPDPTSGGRITPRTYTLLRALEQNGMAGDGIGCFAQRPANPDSDHPQGRACDIIVNPRDQRAVAHEWAIARWLIANQARYGINYLIWQGQYWSADEPAWVTYRSSAYGCPNPANVTGCHYDHVHVSVYAGRDGAPQ
jgi:hypothetical protein